VEVLIAPSAFLVVTMHAVAGWAVCGVIAAGARTALGWPTPSVTGLSAVVVFTVCGLAGVVAHEAGHAVAGRMLGHRLVGVRASAIPAVRLDYDDLAGWRRIFVSAAGPVIQMLVGGVLILSARAWSDPSSLAGWETSATAVMSLALPWPSRSDGGKIWRAAIAALIGRTSR